MPLHILLWLLTLTWFKLFFKHTLKTYLSIADCWYRMERHHHGSFHIHGLAWLDNTPNCKNCAEADIAQYWDKFVCTRNTEYLMIALQTSIGLSINILVIYLCRTLMTWTTASKNPVNICQRHTRCLPNYCLCTLPNGQQKCRFGCPKQLQHSTSVHFTHDDSGNWSSMTITPATNDPLLNNYYKHFMLTWSASHDLCLPFDITGAAKYIAKYTSKAEKASVNYTQVY